MNMHGSASLYFSCIYVRDSRASLQCQLVSLKADWDDLVRFAVVVGGIAVHCIGTCASLALIHIGITVPLFLEQRYFFVCFSTSSTQPDGWHSCIVCVCVFMFSFGRNMVFGYKMHLSFLGEEQRCRCENRCREDLYGQKEGAEEKEAQEADQAEGKRETTEALREKSKAKYQIE